MVNRTIAPKIKEITNLTLPVPRKHVLKNGIPVYEINMGTQDIIKVEIVFDAGRPFEHKQLVARATARMMKEGTTKRSSSEIAEQIDFYGATFSVPVNLDNSVFVLYSLTKHFEKLLPLVAEMLLSPSFPEDELNTFIQNSKQRLQVDLSKNDVVAYRTITERIFTDKHPYGYNSMPATYDQLTREDLLLHYKKKYTANNCNIFISGKTSKESIDLLNEYLGQIPRSKEKTTVNFPVNSLSPKVEKITHPDTVQAAIRIGRRLFNKQHPDFEGLFILNTILGGYFGSRLMANIREDKGYTYNIYSTIDTMAMDGYFYIGTEVGNDFVELTKKEIYYELQRLQDELIEEEELQMVRNYLLGNLLTALDGAFNVADIIKNMIVEDLPHESFYRMIEKIKTISAEELRTLARQYFNKKDLWELTVGA